MNIFLVDKSPIICAQALDDLRLNKMILETAQMLCTAYRHLFPDRPTDLLYKQTHVNHPCSIWLRKDLANYVWGVALFNALAWEKLHRSGVNHMSHVKLAKLLNEPIEMHELSYDLEFSFDCSNYFHAIPGERLSVFDNYKMCLIRKWGQDKKQPKWTKRGAPSWANNLADIKIIKG